MLEIWKKMYLCQNYFKTRYIGFHYKKIELHWTDGWQLDLGEWSFKRGQIFTGKRFLLLRGKFVGLEPEWVKINRLIYTKICNYYNNKAIEQSKKRGTAYAVGGTEGWEKYCKYSKIRNYWLFQRSI